MFFFPAHQIIGKYGICSFVIIHLGDPGQPFFPVRYALQNKYQLTGFKRRDQMAFQTAADPRGYRKSSLIRNILRIHRMKGACNAVIAFFAAPQIKFPFVIAHFSHIENVRIMPQRLHPDLH
ncbi:hypothetical protein D3C87_1637760 [compost metagenome]